MVGVCHNIPGHQRFSGVLAFELIFKVARFGLHDEKFAGRQIGKCQSGFFSHDCRGRQIIISPKRQNTFIYQRSRGHNPGNAPLDNAFGLGRVFKLIADRDRHTFFKQLFYNTIELVVRHSRPEDAEALQAFAHALIHASNEPRASAVTGGEQASSSAGRSSEPPANTDRTSSISAYEGLVSRLESLVREIEGSAEPGGTSPELERLRNSFRDVSQARTESGSATPDLQTYMKTLVRNLQSTGDPTLASTGNVINTAA